MEPQTTTATTTTTTTLPDLLFPTIPQLPSLPPLHNHSQPGPLATLPGALVAVEQPVSDGNATCFICGQYLSPDGPKTTLATSDLFPACSATLLDVLGAGLGLGLATNQAVIELCPNCAKLAGSLDEAFCNLYELRQEVSRLFHGNNRPKLTLQLLPRSAATATATSAAATTGLNLDDLAATRSRRGRRKTTTTTTTTTGTTITTTATTTTTTPAATTDATVAATTATAKVKKKGGRPRKPYPCSICRRKFLTPRAAANHMTKDHHHYNLTATTATTTTTTTATTTSNIKLENLENSASTITTTTTTATPAATTAATVTTAATTTTLSSLALKSELPPLQPQLLPQLPPPKQTTAATQLLSTLRPIQPKPQAVRSQAKDGSVIVVVKNTEAPTALISMTPNYPNLPNCVPNSAVAAQRSYSCDVCFKVFADEKSKKMHRIAAHGRRKEGVHTCAFVCKSCDTHTSFPTRRALAAHRRTQHPHTRQAPGRYTCARCQETFMYKYELNRHAETHMPYIQTDAHEFVCRLCGLHVASRAALKIHVHRFHAHEADPAHTDAHNDFLCASCGHLARTRRAFMDHQRAHDPGQTTKNAHTKTVTCTFCHKNMLGSSLRTHVRRMHGEAAYMCASCGEKFCVRSDLMRHVNLRHCAYKAYTCGVCASSFSTSDALRYHRNKVHSTTTHTCTFCPKTYKWKGELRTHMQRAHTHARERFPCAVCARSYADKRKLRHHVLLKHGEGAQTSDEQSLQPQPPTATTTSHHEIQDTPTAAYHQPPQSIVAIPLYNPSANEIAASHLNGPIADEESLEQPITGEIYLVPNLSVPLHEEQVSTTS